MNQDRLYRIASSVARFSHNVRVGGKIEFVKDTGPIRRDVRVQDFNWTPDSLRELSKILWASQRAHSYAMAAFRLFSKIPSSQISPDGLLGGRGYIQNIKEMRTSLAQAAEVLSSFTDTVDDEINAPHWQTTDAPAEQIQDQAEEVKENPAGFVQEEFQEENPEETFDEPIENPEAEDLNPNFESDTTDNGDDDGWGDEGPSEDSSQTQMASQRWADSFADTAKKNKKILERKKKLEEPGEQGSQIPGGTGDQKEGLSIPEQTMHTTTPEGGNYASSIDKLMHAFESRKASTHIADSTVDPESLTGPRIKHIGPGESDFNDGEQYGSDDPTGEALNSGVETTKPIYEGYDAMADGVTGYGDPYTESAESVDMPDTASQIASRVAAIPQTYSWLPGADNTKNLDYYALGLTPEDTAWLRAHSQPEMPNGMAREKERPEIPDNLWGESGF